MNVTLCYQYNVNRHVATPHFSQTEQLEEAEAEGAQSSTVLGNEVLTEIQRDIVATTFPSWIERPPAKFGEPGHGKLKADHWRTVCTISLVITLVRLWGTSSANAWEKRILANFIDLVIAVETATKRTTSPERIQMYKFYMLRYLRSVQELFNAELRPNHHLALHIDECLSGLGPAHSWWCFPFERYNGVIARLNTNHKPSECICSAA